MSVYLNVCMHTPHARLTPTEANGGHQVPEKML